MYNIIMQDTVGYYTVYEIQLHMEMQDVIEDTRCNLIFKIQEDKDYA